MNVTFRLQDSHQPEEQARDASNWLARYAQGREVAEPDDFRILSDLFLTLRDEIEFLKNFESEQHRLYEENDDEYND